MEYCEYDEKDLQLVILAYSFDFHSVESHMGFDRAYVMQMFEDFDNIADDLNLMGFYDISDVLIDAFSGYMGCVNHRMEDYARNRIVTTDYFATLWDMTGDEPNVTGDDVSEFANYLLRLYNIITIGLLFNLDEGQVHFLRSHVARHHDIAHDDPGLIDGMIEFIGDNITFNCYVPLYVPSPEEDSDYDEAGAGVHSNLINRVLQRLHDVTGRSTTIS